MTTASSSAAAASKPMLPAAHRDVRVAIGALASVQVRLYGARQRGTVAPLVVHFHGGAFTGGGVENGVTFASLLAGSGAIVASIAYPLAPAHPFPQAVEAGYSVLEWAYKQRSKLAGAGAPVYLAGEEAGGNLAAAVALIARDRAHPSLAGQILVSPMLDPCVGTASARQAAGPPTGCKWADGWQQYLRCPQDAEHPYAVPGASSRLAGLAPTLVLTAGDDPMRDEARAYATKLGAAGVPVCFEVLPATTGWPDALLAAVPVECPCGVAVITRLRAFFDANAPSTGAAVPSQES